MKTFVLAPDSFKESMTAEQACTAMQRGIQKIIPDAVCVHVPMADGGEGTVDALLTSLAGQKVECDVTGPLPSQRIKTYWGLFDEGQTAVIEMAKANGIHLLEPAQRNPLLTTTLGTGQMICHALDLGVSKIILALGGSVTNDAGSGMAQALGVRFLDVQGREVLLGGGHLQEIEWMDMQALDPRLQKVQVLIASDVTNPLCGTQGASYVFGTQKGASAVMVEQLDQNLSHFADVVETQLNMQIRNVVGAGAAGGLGFGLMAFTGAKLRSGATWVIEQTQLAEKIKQADYVFTGEGSIDFQTKFGKTPWAVAQFAKQLNKPVIAFAGRVGEDIESLFDEGFSQIISLNEPNCDLTTALKHAEHNLEKSCEKVVQQLLNGG